MAMVFFYDKGGGVLNCVHNCKQRNLDWVPLKLGVPIENFNVIPQHQCMLFSVSPPLVQLLRSAFSFESFVVEICTSLTLSSYAKIFY